MSDRKKCTQCLVLLPVTHFSPCRNGLQPACKACRNAKAKAKDYAPTVAEATCRSCKEIKPAGDFYRNRHKKSGLQAEGKDCNNKRQKAVSHPVTLQEKYCPDCARTLPATEFPKHKKRVGGLRTTCRECSAIVNCATLYRIPKELARELRTRPCCDLCGERYKNTSDINVDHCHVSGSVRGAICTCCNLMLGGGRAGPEILMRAVRYLLGAGRWRPLLEVVRA